MKRNLIWVAMAALLGLTLFIRYLGSSPGGEGRFDGARVMGAVRAYTQDHRARNVPLPTSVSLDALIQAGWLRKSDVSGLEGMDVRIHLGADETRPGEAIVRVRMTDGREIALLADGSVQEVWSGR